MWTPAGNAYNRHKARMNNNANASNEIAEWAKEGIEKIGSDVTRTSGQLTNNVTEERMFKSKLMDLSKARYKLRVQRDYEKRVFIENMRKKGSVFRGLLKDVEMKKRRDFGEGGTIENPRQDGSHKAKRIPEPTRMFAVGKPSQSLQGVNVGRSSSQQTLSGTTDEPKDAGIREMAAKISKGRIRLRPSTVYCHHATCRSENGLVVPRGTGTGSSRRHQVSTAWPRHRRPVLVSTTELPQRSRTMPCIGEDPDEEVSENPPRVPNLWNAVVPRTRCCLLPLADQRYLSLKTCLSRTDRSTRINGTVIRNLDSYKRQTETVDPLKSRMNEHVEKFLADVGITG